MKVFISWSGERSRQVGELLDEWLKCVIQAIDPWRSDRDIDRGSMWFTQISNQLQETSMGIICITQENKNNPWILFESGALSKGLSSSRIFTFLIDLDHTDIKDPLAQFNHTKPSEESVKGLVRTLNSTLEDKRLPDKILEEVFNTYWPQFRDRFNTIIKGTPEQAVVEVRSEEDILSEILERTRAMDRRLSSVERNDKRSRNEVELRSDMHGRKDFVKSNRDINLVNKRIRQLLENEVPISEIIVEISKSYNIPPGVVESLVNSFLNEME